MECHVLLVIFPVQGHINPSLEFAKRLVKLGVKVTLSTSLLALNRMSRRPEIEGLDFAPFSDGFDDGLKGVELNDYWVSLKNRGSEAVANLIAAKAEEGAPFARIICTTIMSWVGLVAHRFRVPITVLWIQPAAVLDIYYHYFTEYGDLFRNCSGNQLVEVPGAPALSAGDFPTFLFSTTNDMDWAIQGMKAQIELINREESPTILVNTFDALEMEALKGIKKARMVGIGPLIPSAYLDGKDPSDTGFGGDLRERTDGCVEWLDSKPKGSVIYVAFGSYSDLPNTMMEEIAQGIIQSKKPFLWVMRETAEGEKPEEKLSCRVELEREGKMVRWCKQVEVLNHPSVGCFLTHCGWNSTLESITSGVPLVACPLWNDQFTNAKLIQDVWKCGVRVSADEEGVVRADEYKMCIECVMGEGGKGEELRRNAKKLKDLAMAATKDDGSSFLNLKAYVDQVLTST